VTSRRLALLSLAATYLFFFEYLPPFKRVHLPYDMEGFHYPLLNYAAKSLGEGRFPEWDPSTYCGLSFAGNLQAGLFYPPNWILLAIGAFRGGLPFKALEVVVLLHIWLAYFLCYLWLRRRFDLLPSVLAAAVYAYSGYMVSQIQHYGVIAASAWLPLALLAIEEKRPRGLWRLAVASALAFLAGYPPAWFAFAILTLVYAAVARSWRRVAEVAVTLAFSLLLVSVQLFPALESATLKTPEKKYGGGIQGAEFYLSFFLPNYFNLNRSSNAPGEPTAQYFYLGAPALFALAWTLYRRRLNTPALALAAVSLVFMTNPFHLVEPVVDRLPFLSEICRDWNFLAGLPLAAALLTAASLQDFFAQSPARPVATIVPVVLATAWCLRQFVIWLPGGRDFSSGWAAALDPAVTLAVFSLLLFTSRSPVILLILVGVDYKVFGSNRRFNAADFDADRFFSDARASRRLEFYGLHGQVYRTVLADPASRVAIDDPGPHPTDFRHYRLSTPQGFDPLLPAPYKRAVEAFTPFRTDRLFQVDPANQAMLQRLAVRYYLTSVHSSSHSFLAASPDFRLLQPAESFFRVFEYLHAVPIYRWENVIGTAERVSWTPERRELRVHSNSGGRFVLIEQYFPGWTATIDGAAVPIERWGEAFQAVQVPAGEHRVQFLFHSRGLRLGALVSLASLVILCLVARSSSA
jgi:hypothetical protein